MQRCPVCKDLEYECTRTRTSKCHIRNDNLREKHQQLFCRLRQNDINLVKILPFKFDQLLTTMRVLCHARNRQTLEKRLRICPVGVVSKNDIGARATCEAQVCVNTSTVYQLGILTLLNTLRCRADDERSVTLVNAYPRTNCMVM